jgi:hypothetical protein
VPTDDPRLEQALRDAAPVVGAVGVLDRVEAKRVHRRRQRRVVTAASALAVFVLLLVATALVVRDDPSPPQVAAPGAGMSAKVVTGDDARAEGRSETPRAVALDTDPGVIVPPVSVGSASVSTASHDRGTDGQPLTHVVRIDGTHVVDVVNLKADVVSIAEGEGARWALTQNLRAADATIPDTFLKRIGTVGEPVSTLLPRDSDPVGPVAAVGGAVWVPVRDGVLQFDPVTASLIRKITLPNAETRFVAQVGKGAYATDGRVLRRLDPVAGLGDTVDFGTPIIGLAAAGFDSRVLLRNDQEGVERAQVANAVSSEPLRVTAVLPAGFQPLRLEASPTRLWVTGTVDGAPAIVLLGDAGVRATVVIQNARQAALVWSAPETVTAVADGRLFTIDLA